MKTKLLKSVKEKLKCSKDQCFEYVEAKRDRHAILVQKCNSYMNNEIYACLNPKDSTAT